MDAIDFFRHVVVENYKEANADPTNFRKQWNAAVSMNTLAEYLGLHRAEYPELKRNEVIEKAEAIRSQYPILGEVKSSRKYTKTRSQPQRPTSNCIID